MISGLISALKHYYLTQAQSKNKASCRAQNHIKGMGFTRREIVQPAIINPAILGFGDDKQISVCVA
jgi:hypothetical protein